MYVKHTVPGTCYLDCTMNAIHKDFMKTTPRKGMLLPYGTRLLTSNNKYTHITQYCVNNITYTKQLPNCFPKWGKMASLTCKLSAIRVNP